MSKDKAVVYDLCSDEERNSSDEIFAFTMKRKPDLFFIDCDDGDANPRKKQKCADFMSGDAGCSSSDVQHLNVEGEVSSSKVQKVEFDSSPDDGTSAMNNQVIDLTGPEKFGEAQVELSAVKTIPELIDLTVQIMPVPVSNVGGEEVKKGAVEMKQVPIEGPPQLIDLTAEGKVEDSGPLSRKIIAVAENGDVDPVVDGPGEDGGASAKVEPAVALNNQNIPVGTNGDGCGTDGGASPDSFSTVAYSPPSETDMYLPDLPELAQN